MFILDAFHTFVWSFLFYFSSPIFICLGIITALGRIVQVSFKDKFNKAIYILIEVLVEDLRLLQYILFISIGSGIALKVHDLWHSINHGLRQITLSQILWDFAGFIIVFGIYNVLVIALFNKSTIQLIIKWLHIESHSDRSVKLSLILGFKNLFLIPISVVYLFHMFYFI